MGGALYRRKGCRVPADRTGMCPIARVGLGPEPIPGSQADAVDLDSPGERQLAELPPSDAHRHRARGSKPLSGRTGPLRVELGRALQRVTVRADPFHVKRRCSGLR